jgi:pSer/pThr/pTyr-binding forkhead associated (FHA) protein
MSHVYCPECGFQNPETANYCAKCGAALVKPDESEATMTFTPEDADDALAAALEDVAIHGPALIVRSGGGRSGEVFNVSGERMTIGRSPDAEIFLDDVTVSRNHALLVRRRDGLYIDDLGSLNGTYVNRRRIESHKLAGGDELQVGKYKLTYLDK